VIHDVSHFGLDGTLKPCSDTKSSPWARSWVDQRSRDLLWGHPDFMTTPRTDGQWVAFGHVIQDEPVMAEGRIALDTGAYATGVLTAAVLGDGPPRFVTA
jgi:serine/threonine protein phosphatase 1